MEEVPELIALEDLHLQAMYFITFFVACLVRWFESTDEFTVTVSESHLTSMCVSQFIW